MTCIIQKAGVQVQHLAFCIIQKYEYDPREKANSAKVQSKQASSYWVESRSVFGAKAMAEGSEESAAAPEGTGGQHEDGQSVVLEGPYSRLMGATEHNWCRAVDTGTGITVLGLLFSRRIDVGDLQAALEGVLWRHPRLRSQLMWVGDKPAFQVNEEQQQPSVQVEEVDAAACSEDEDWLMHVEAELNINPWKDEHRQPMPVLVARLHRLAAHKSLFVIRVHTAACDRASAAIVMVEILHSLKDGGGSKSFQGDDSCDKEEQLVAVEDAVPKGQANKPFWAHGVDLLGYSLGSLRHALLPFENAEATTRQTQLIRTILSVDHTQALFQRCTKEKTNLFGALTAAGLKATTIYKQLGNRSEHFAIIGLVDCRGLIDLLSNSTVGFYHSAIMNTHHVNEVTGFWDLARRCSDSLNNATKNRKHFTDMGDINYLMYQALQHPNLTPASSLRTSLMVAFQEAISDEFGDLKELLGLEDYVGCSSVHGIGPTLAIFDSIRDGALYCNIVYPAPLYSREQMQKVVNSMMDLLVDSLA